MSFSDQLQLLQARGLQVENQAAAQDYLERLGYYRLSGYWYPLRVIDLAASQAKGKAVRQDAFVQGSRFEEVARLYVFDKKLRLLALDALERIEMAVRVDVAHLLGQRDALAHEKPPCLHGKFTKVQIQHGRDRGKTGHQVWLEKYRAMLDRARNEPFVAHHMQEYGTLPIWAAIELWDFGLLSWLFSGMQQADQQTIAVSYGAQDGRAFAQWLRSLNFIRNVSAHHSRLWNINVVDISPLPQGWPQSLKNSRPFFYFCLMQRLLKVICPGSTWGQRFRDLLRTEFPAGYSVKELGAFPNWEGWALWQ